MTKEELRIAIAEWMGWKWELHKKESNWWLTNPSCELVYGDCEDIYPVNQIPDYPNDLNAIHEAENKLPAHLRSTYTVKLREIVMRDHNDSMKDIDSGIVCDIYFYGATASQRSEALCRTLWPERFETMKGKE